MKLSEIMTSHVEVISPDTTIEKAAQKMREIGVGSIPVCDGDRLKGILTDRDITIRAVAEGRDPHTTMANETMTPHVVYIYDDQSVEEAASIMSQYQIRRLPVINREKRLVGIVSLGDLSVDTGEEGMAGRTLENISQPSRPE